jgi:CheY-like chemotaxis protein
MCHEYIKLMNGTLTLLSTPSNGSRFDFIVDLKVMPNLATSMTTVKEIPASRSISESANANILIVEDNPTNQLVLKGILKKLGHHTNVAENGIQALEILANAEFDLILMDCQMPEMDGFEATRAIRSGNRLKDIPIIAVTANVMEGDEQRCLDVGMNDYMKKPIKKELLIKKIDQWYNNHRFSKH